MGYHFPVSGKDTTAVTSLSLKGVQLKGYNLRQILTRPLLSMMRSTDWYMSIDLKDAFSSTVQWRSGTGNT